MPPTEPILLSPAEARVLGALVEKEVTTPYYYPLSLNALVNACNQKSNRDPAVSFDETTVEQALSTLQQKGLALRTQAGGSRVAKFLHSLLDRLDLSRQEIALLCELLVRGPQTVGELRGRCERMQPFTTLEEVELALRTMAEHDPPLVRRLARGAGRKEPRFAHLLSGEPDVAADAAAYPISPGTTPDERVRRLEEQVDRISNELGELRRAFEEFRRQF